MSEATSDRDPLGLVRSFDAAGPSGRLVSLAAIEERGWGRVSRMPVSLRIILESMARHCDGERVRAEQVRSFAAWRPGSVRTEEIPFIVSRVLLQDLSGLPVLNDLAAMRAEAARHGLDPTGIEPVVPVDLVVDHAVSVDVQGRPDALRINLQAEYERNGERLRLLKWAQQAFARVHVVPPGHGIVHQINLERLARCVTESNGLYHPETLVGTDSHTPMVNALGVLGWGVGGLEAFAAMLGEPVGLLFPDVVGVHLRGALRPGVTATDLVLTLTERLRAAGVVNRFVEYFGPGARALAVADRATVANMAPDQGATCGFFAADERTIAYLAATGRPAAHVALVERYLRAQGLFGIPLQGDCDYSEVIDVDLSTIGASLAGPSKPQQRLPLADLRPRFDALMAERGLAAGAAGAAANEPSTGAAPRHGDILVAAITSCTNTSNPRLMLAAGLLASKAVAAGLAVPAHVKTSLAPGSRVVDAYLRAAGLMPALEALGFHVVAHGCTTCMGNSGPLLPGLEEAVTRGDVVACAVLSGNRNFEGRIHEAIQANFLASPALVVALAIAGTVRIDLETEPVGLGRAGRPVYLRDLLPTDAEVDGLLALAMNPALYRDAYERLDVAQDAWRAVPAGAGPTFDWPDGSTYLVEPPFFAGSPESAPRGLRGARVLAVFGDGVTTDHITPNGRIRPDSPAGRWLTDVARVPESELNTYAMRRCNHHVLVRGAFDHPRLRNALAGGELGGVTRLKPEGELVSLFDAAEQLRSEGAPLVIVAGREYGTGSSRDWAARAPALLGVRAVIASSFERIHRSNLVCMGILPCELPDGIGPADLRLDGSESIDLEGLEQGPQPRQDAVLVVRRPGGEVRRLTVRLRIDTALDAAYACAGGILPHVLRRQLASQAPPRG